MFSNYYENVSNAPYYENVYGICDEYGHFTSECPINYPVQHFECEGSNSNLASENFYPNHYVTPSYPSYGWENEPHDLSSSLRPPNESPHYPTYEDSTEQALENTFYEFMQYQMEFNAQVAQQISEIGDQFNTLTHAIIVMDEEQHIEHSQCIEVDPPNEMDIDVESSTTLDCETFNEVSISHKANEPNVILPSLSDVEIHISQLGECIEMESSVLNEKLYIPFVALHKLAYILVRLRFLNNYLLYCWIDWIERALMQQKNFKIKKIHERKVISELKPD